MKLRGIDFGPVWGASGVTGFFGEGYPFHRIFRPFGLNFKGMTFVAKTTSLPPRKGNMPLREDGITPRHLKPQCIVVNLWRGIGLNAVSLSGPGAKALFEDGRWQKRTRPFFLSFAAVRATKEERFLELKGFLSLLKTWLREFDVIIGLQLNFSCPNTGVEEFFVEEIKEFLTEASVLNIPLVVKLSVLVPPSVAKTIAEHPACDALSVSNTIPWGALPEKIKWKELFGSEVSPLAQFGGGGLSGKPLFPLVVAWLIAAKNVERIQKPICAGGGILSKKEIATLRRYGADAVSLGSVAFLRPWRVRGLISAAHRYFT